MKIKIFDTVELSNAYIINEVVERLSTTCKVLGLATGSTFLEVYSKLISLNKEKRICFKDIKTFNLDEYIDIPHDHSQRYRNFMNKYLFFDINIMQDHIFFPITENQFNYEQYDDTIKEYQGIDLQLLGIGHNGHIGFNEPGTPFDSKTHKASLTEETRRMNQRFFNHLDEVPKHAVTMGIQTIMDAKEIIIFAYGLAKAPAIKGMIEDEITENLPASILQRHPNVTVVLDKEAASLLTKKY